MMSIRNLLKLIISLMIPLGLGAIAGMFTAQAVPDWYASLNRPSFNPPGWIFGPVWTTLYLLMGISLFLVWKEPSGKNRNLAIAFFTIQMVLNFGWSFIFFYFNRIGLAFLEILLLWGAIVAMIYWFNKVKPIAAWINVPYLLWVSFAAVLNGSIYYLNHG